MTLTWPTLDLALLPPSSPPFSPLASRLAADASGSSMNPFNALDDGPIAEIIPFLHALDLARLSGSCRRFSERAFLRLVEDVARERIQLLSRQYQYEFDGGRRRCPKRRLEGSITTARHSVLTLLRSLSEIVRMLRFTLVSGPEVDVGPNCGWDLPAHPAGTVASNRTPWSGGYTKSAVCGDYVMRSGVHHAEFTLLELYDSFSAIGVVGADFDPTATPNEPASCQGSAVMFDLHTGRRTAGHSYQIEWVGRPDHGTFQDAFMGVGGYSAPYVRPSDSVVRSDGGNSGLLRATNSHVVGILVDVDRGTMSISHNGTWLGIIAQRGVKQMRDDVYCVEPPKVYGNKRVLRPPLRWAVDIANVASIQIERKDPVQFSEEEKAEQKKLAEDLFREEYRAWEENGAWCDLDIEEYHEEIPYEP